LQGALEKEQKLKEKLHVKQDDNNEVLAKLHTTRQNISNMEKYNKGLENIKLERDSL
jgi:transcriptional regulator